MKESKLNSNKNNINICTHKNKSECKVISFHLIFHRTQPAQLLFPTFKFPSKDLYQIKITRTFNRLSRIIYSKYASHFKSKTLYDANLFLWKTKQNKLELFVTTMDSIKHKKLSLRVWWFCFCCLATPPTNCVRNLRLVGKWRKINNFS